MECSPEAATILAVTSYPSLASTMIGGMVSNRLMRNKDTESG